MPALTNLLIELEKSLLGSEDFRFSKELLEKRLKSIGYPGNQNTDLKEFYEWYLKSGLYQGVWNNVGDPREESNYRLNTHLIENEVIDFFAPLFGFTTKETWGMVTTGGTDGNNHGIYFGAKYLANKTGQRPILYVSNEAHYSVKKLADLQNLELVIVPADANGQMALSEFERLLEPKRPALLVIAIGTTFKGAMDDQIGIQSVLIRKNPIAVYRHIDAALFGGYIPFLPHNQILNRKNVFFDSIAISGHKFFGFDEPVGLFITHSEILNKLNPIHVPYLDDAIPTISCSRSALAPLKFWWKIKRNQKEGFQKQLNQILSNAHYLKEKLDALRYPCWLNPYSNIVYFKRPSEKIIKKYDLAKEDDSRLGGTLAHILIMQHVSRELIDEFIQDIQHEKKPIS